jgi:hypothetical protein
VNGHPGSEGVDRVLAGDVFQVDDLIAAVLGDLRER